MLKGELKDIRREAVFDEYRAQIRSLNKKNRMLSDDNASLIARMHSQGMKERAIAAFEKFVISHGFDEEECKSEFRKALE